LKEEENYCAKCCKTRQVIERMLKEIPTLEENVDIEYKIINFNEQVENYGKLIPPVIIINGEIFSEGHVPIIKKLSSELFKLTKQFN
jgi:hypothetical protein